jgi:hypothetical protein
LRGGLRIEDEALLTEPNEPRDREIPDDAGEEEELQRGKGDLNAAAPSRP